MTRFGGTVEVLSPVGSSQMAAWIAAIPFEDWDQQHRRPDLPLRPAMMTNLDWHGFGDQAWPLVERLLGWFPEGYRADQRMLSVVMPGQSIEPHTDIQPPNWICRVHVPLTSNPESRFIVGEEAHHLTPGWAYKVNTEAVHSVENAGATPRIHFMFDVRKPG